MPHSLIYNPDSHLVEIIGWEVIYLNEFRNIFSEAMCIASKYNSYLFLHDYRKATLSLNNVEFFEIPKIIKKESSFHQIDFLLIKNAIIQSKDREIFHFYESIILNSLQYHTTLFYDINSARNWLFVQQLSLYKDYTVHH